MSKQVEAKLAQGYQDKPNTCGTCKHRKFELALPAWMLEINLNARANGNPPVYGDSQLIAKKNRCGLGGFAVKVSAFCRKHES